MKPFIAIIIVQVALIGCREPCKDIAYPSDFTSAELSKFPVFNKISTGDTSKALYIDETGHQIDLVLRLSSSYSYFDDSKAFRNSSITCQRVSYRTIQFNIDSTFGKFYYNDGYQLIKYNTTSDFRSMFPDSVSIATSYHYIGDTIINGKLYQKAYGFKGRFSTLRSYYVANISDGLIYFELPFSKKKFWKVP